MNTLEIQQELDKITAIASKSPSGVSSGDEALVFVSIVKLTGNALVNLARIANALEKIAAGTEPSPFALQ